MNETSVRDVGSRLVRLCGARLTRIEISRCGMMLALLTALHACMPDLRAKDVESMSLDSLMAIPISAASKYKQTSLEVPASVTVLTSEDIRRYGWMSLEEALQSVSGLYLTNDRTYMYIGTRGFGRPSDYNNRIILMINGLTVNEGIWGSMLPDFNIGMDIIDHIEVVKGPGSVIHGPGAMFAVINVVTKSASGQTGVRVAASEGIPDGQTYSASCGRRMKGGLELSCAVQADQLGGENLYFRQYDDPATNFGKSNGNDWKHSRGGWAGLRWKGLSTQAYVVSRQKAIPTAAYATTFNSKDANFTDSYYGGEINLENSLSPRFSLNSSAHLTGYYFNGEYPYEPISPLFTDIADWRSAGAEVRGLWDPYPFNRMIVGVEFDRRYRVTERGGSAGFPLDYDLSKPTTQLSAYVQDEHQIGSALTVTGGLRVTRYDKTSFDASPRVALVSRPGERTTLKLLYGSAFRVPNLDEVTVAVNPDGSQLHLNQEKIQTAELMIERNLGQNLDVASSIFNYSVLDLIEKAIDSTSGAQLARNMGRAGATGIEVQISVRQMIGFDGYVNWSYQSARDEISDRILSNSPAHLVKLGLSHRVTRFAHAAIEFRYESSRGTVIHTSTKPATNVNLAISSSSAVEPWSISLRVMNLLDQLVEMPLGPEYMTPSNAVDMPVVQQPRRSFGVRVGYSF